MESSTRMECVNTLCVTIKLVSNWLQLFSYFYLKIKFFIATKTYCSYLLFYRICKRQTKKKIKKRHQMFLMFVCMLFVYLSVLLLRTFILSCNITFFMQKIVPYIIYSHNNNAVCIFIFFFFFLTKEMVFDYDFKRKCLPGFKLSQHYLRYLVSCLQISLYNFYFILGQ